MSTDFLYCKPSAWLIIHYQLLYYTIEANNISNIVFLQYYFEKVKIQVTDSPNNNRYNHIITQLGKHKISIKHDADHID